MVQSTDQKISKVEKAIKRKRSVPSFKNLRPSSERASYTLSRNRSIDTRCEQLICVELKRLGLRFRKNVRTLPGIPDIVFSQERVVVFCDGDFWHGRDWDKRKQKLRKGSNGNYWVQKIQSNIDRDRQQSRTLRQLGWKVIRIWERDILTDTSRMAQKIARYVLARQVA